MKIPENGSIPNAKRQNSAASSDRIPSVGTLKMSDKEEDNIIVLESSL